MHSRVAAEDPIAPSDDPGKHEEIEDQIESSPDIDDPLMVLESVFEC